MKKYYLSVLAIFKNETYVLKEWIDHYISEGVEHFYMIDNNSNDDPDTILKPYIDDGMVDLFHERRKQRFIQLPAYNRLFPKLKVESEWLLVIDLDEIMYARNGYNTIIDFIRENDNETFSEILGGGGLYFIKNHNLVSLRPIVTFGFVTKPSVLWKVKKIGIMFSGTSSYFPRDFETTIGFVITFISLSTNFVMMW